MPPALHLTCKVAQFRSAFAKAAKLAPSKSPKAVLENVALSAADGDSPATFSATNLEAGLVIDIPGATILSPGRCLLPTRIGAALASLPPDAILDLSVDDKHIHLSAPGWKSKLNGEEPDLFPVVPGADTGELFATVGGGDLKTAIARTSYATDPESTRYSLSGCCAERDVESSSLVLVATDGRRLVKATIPADFEAPGDTPPGDVKPVIPKRALDLIAGLIDPDGVVELRIDANRAVVAHQGGWSLYTRLVEGRYPAWRDVLVDPSSAVVRATVDSSELLAAVQRVAAIACSEESRGLGLTFKPEGLEIASDSSERGQSDGFVAATYDTASDGLRPVPDEGVFACIDNRYLVELLKSSAPETLVFRLIDHKSPVAAEGDGGATVAILMPLSVDR